MKTFIEYVDEAQKKLGIESDAGLSKKLGGGDNRTLVSNWRNKGVVPEDYYCILITEILDIDPLEIIAAANFARSKDDERKAFWENFAKQHVKTVVGVLLGLAVCFGGFSVAANAEKAAVVVAVFGMLLSAHNARFRKVAVNF
jgi:hypothetical protein